MAEFVTTPIYYPNDVPHIGTLYSTTAADVYARYARVRGKDAYMLTGTDEHGKKIANAARADGEDPKDFVDELSRHFKSAFEDRVPIIVEKSSGRGGGKIRPDGKKSHRAALGLELLTTVEPNPTSRDDRFEHKFQRRGTRTNPVR